MGFIGVLLSFGALFGWAFGDFLIQKTMRKTGLWEVRLAINIFPVIGLLPFVWGDLGAFFADAQLVVALTVVSAVLLVAGYVSFRALEDGKLSVVEPITGLEVPITVALAFFFLGERIAWMHSLLILIIFIGIVLASTRRSNAKAFGFRKLEAGALLALSAAFGLALVNFSVAVAGRLVSPLIVNWYTGLLLAIVCVIRLAMLNRLQGVPAHYRRHARDLLIMCAFTNTGWLCFVYAATLLPIGVVTAISECFILLATYLGVVVNHEKLQRHQKFGVFLAMCGVIVLAALTAQ